MDNETKLEFCNYIAERLELISSNEGKSGNEIVEDVGRVKELMLLTDKLQVGIIT